VIEGHPEPSDEEVLAFIGPPTRVGFAHMIGADPESPEVEACVAAYRARYVDELKLTPSFPGMPEAVRELRDEFRLGVATSKPQEFAEQVLEVMGMRDAFDVVAGPAMTGTEGKDPVVARAMEQLGRGSCLAMVGDRRPDMLAARNHGLLAVGALWGFGSAEELEDAGAQVLVNQPDELAGVLREAASRASRDTSSCTTGP
jgi:phosphoglycolate phosphatase